MPAKAGIQPAATGFPLSSKEKKAAALDYPWRVLRHGAEFILSAAGGVEGRQAQDEVFS